MKIPGFRTFKKIFYPLNRVGIVLMYHRVTDLDYDPMRLNVSPGHFAEQMQVLKKYGRPLKMRDMENSLKNFRLGEIGIAVTLDDGYADNFHNARLIFEKTDVPATFYIISGALDGQEEFFWDDLKTTILAPETIPPVFEMNIAGKKYHWEIAFSGKCQSVDYRQSLAGMPSGDIKLTRYQLYEWLMKIITPLYTEQKKEVLKQLAQWSGQHLTVRKDFLPMTSSELRSLASCPLFEIGAHTVHHPRLADLPIQTQQEEIGHSKNDLENKLNRTITSFCYPFGSYNAETVNLVKASRFQNACTVEANQVMRDTDPYLLPRFAVNDWNGDEFEKNLRNWLSLYN